MKILLMKILHFLWIRRDNIYSIFKEIRSNPKINIDGKISFEEFEEYYRIFSKSGVTKESFLLDDNIISGDIINDKINPNTSKRLLLNEQDSMTCVPDSLIRMINYNTNVVIDLEKRDEYIEDLKRLKILTDKGSSIKEVASYLKNAVKKDFGVELVYFREPIGSDKYNQLLENNYSHSLGGGISAEYLLDFKSDGDIDIENYDFKEKIKYYHLFMNLPDEEADKRGGNIVENYNKKLGIRNIYKNGYIDKFGDKGVFFDYGYFFIAKSEVDDSKLEEEKKNIIKDIENNRFYKILKPHIENGYSPIFNDYEDSANITSGEVKALIDLAYIRKSK